MHELSAENLLDRIAAGAIEFVSKSSTKLARYDRTRRTGARSFKSLLQSYADSTHHQIRTQYRHSEHGSVEVSNWGLVPLVRPFHWHILVTHSHHDDDLRAQPQTELKIHCSGQSCKLFQRALCSASPSPASGRQQIIILEGSKLDSQSVSPSQLSLTSSTGSATWTPTDSMRGNMQPAATHPNTLRRSLICSVSCCADSFAAQPKASWSSQTCTGHAQSSSVAAPERDIEVIPSLSKSSCQSS
jgi:hypothetical protein